MGETTSTTSTTPKNHSSQGVMNGPKEIFALPAKVLDFSHGLCYIIIVMKQHITYIK
jgi:hypothetical protein